MMTRKVYLVIFTYLVDVVTITNENFHSSTLRGKFIKLLVFERSGSVAYIKKLETYKILSFL